MQVGKIHSRQQHESRSLVGRQSVAADEAAALMLLSRMTFANLHLFRFSHTQRNAILDAALRYFRLHNSTVGTMRSPEILRQIFA